MGKLNAVTLAAAKKYTDIVVAGGGAIKGKNCVISDISAITGGNRVTFQWTLDNGTVQTGTMDVMDGETGETGLGVKSVAINASNHLIVTYDDDTTEDAGEITNITTSMSHITDIDLENLTDGQILKYNGTTHKWENASAGTVETSLEDLNDVDIDNATDGQIIAWDATAGRWVNVDNAPTITIDSQPTEGSTNAVSSGGVYSALAGKVDTENGKGLSTEDYTSAEKTKLGGIETGAEVNTIESISVNGTAVAPDANKNVALTVMTNAVNDLVNYYLKTETYTKTEVNTLIGGVSTISFSVVQQLPTTDIQTNVIYLVPSADPGTQNVKDEYINLDGTSFGWELIGSTAIDLSGYVTDTDLATALADYTTTTDLTTLLAGKADTADMPGIATTLVAGLVKPDGTTITVAADGTISSVGGTGQMLTGTLLAAGWSNKSQTITVTGLKASDVGAIGILNTATSAQIDAARGAVITPTTVAANSVTFTCENVPSVDIPFGVLVGGGAGGGGSTYTAGDGIDITNDEISVKVDGETITVDEFGVLHASGGGGGIAIGDVTGAAYTTYHETVSLTWTDPNDIEISGVPVAQWKGTKVVRKVGIAPASVTDGTLIANVTTRNQYSSSPLVDNTVEYGNTYYYRFFPYTRQNEVTTGTSLSVTPEKEQITTAPTVSGSYTYDGTEQTPTWTGYDSSKMDISGDYAETNAGTYTVTFTAKHDYEFFIGGQTSSTVTATWTMAKAAGGVTLSANSVVLNQEHITATVTISNPTGEIDSVTSSDPTVAVASLSGLTLTISQPQDGEDGTATITVSVAASTNYNATSATIAVECDFVPALEDASWSLISQFSAQGKASSAWSVGERKSVTLSGTCGTTTLSLSVDLFILGFDHNSSIEGTGITFGFYKNGTGNYCDKALTDAAYNTTNSDGTKNYQLNHWGGTNYGGWKGCDMRYDILGSTDIQPSDYGTMPLSGRVGYDATSTAATSPVNNTLMSCLPQDLRAVMKPITKYTNNTGGRIKTATLSSSIDYLPLMSSYETVGSSGNYFSGDESTYAAQYAYYINGNSARKYMHGDSTTATYWLRSPRIDSESQWCQSQGSTSTDEANESSGLSPVFLV